MDEKAKELEQFFSREDYQNYTIKVHALKSSCRLIGATKTADKAQLLENAGKEENTGYIRENHSSFMEEYLRYKDVLKTVFEKEETEDESNKPVADDFLMESVYEGMLDAAERMDIDAMEDILKEIEDYSIPEKEKEKFRDMCKMMDVFDYDGIVNLLKNP